MSGSPSPGRKSIGQLSKVRSQSQLSGERLQLAEENQLDTGFAIEVTKQLKKIESSPRRSTKNSMALSSKIATGNKLNTV